MTALDAPAICGQPPGACAHFACGLEIGRRIDEDMIDRAVAAFWAQDLYEHTAEETRAAMRDALAAALAPSEP